MAERQQNEDLLEDSGYFGPDFTLGAYAELLDILLGSGLPIVPAIDVIGVENRDSFCILRHDVAHYPKRALAMAKIEYEKGIRASYFFRDRSYSMDENVIVQLQKMGHEIGYLYECLDDSAGDLLVALDLFEQGIKKLRRLAPIRTVASKCNPDSGFDNRDLWQRKRRHRMLLEDFGASGELYLAIDYREVCCINDYDRDWFSRRLNQLENVESLVTVDFHSREELLEYLRKPPVKKIVLRITPERWSSSFQQYVRIFSRDLCKKIFGKFRSG